MGSEPSSTPVGARSGPRPGAEVSYRTSFWRAYQIGRWAVLGLLDSPLPQMAAALSYRTIFSLIPALVIGLVVVGSFSSDEDVETVIHDLAEYTGIAGIYVSELPPEVGPPEPAGLRPEAVPEDDGTVHLDDFISGLVERVRSIKFGAIGAVGLIALIYAAISMLVELERAFNAIYRAPAGHGWLRRIAQYWTMLTLGTVFLIASFYVGERFKLAVASLGASESGVLLVAAGYAVTVAISTLLLLLVYLLVPNTSVHVRPALVGAIIAAVLWEAGKWAFTQYVRYSFSYAQLYGSIALIPLFMLWIYVTWLIVLLGLQIAAALQGFQRWLREKDDHTEPSSVMADPASALPLVAAVAARFKDGRPIDSRSAAESAGLAEPLAVRLLERLAEEGLLHRVAGAGERSFVLARPPEDIPASRVLEIAQALAAVEEDPKCSGVMEAIRRAQRAAAEGYTMAMLAGLPPRRSDPS